MLGDSAPSASRHGGMGITHGLAIDLYRWMLLTRRLDERIWRLNRQGEVPFAIPCRGQEAAQVGSAAAADAGRDVLLPYPRDLGVVLVAGMTPREVLLSALARNDDPSSGGRQLPMHWGHERLKILSSSSPVGTQIPQAVGVALAARLRGDDSVAVCYFGDGATSKADFYEGLNFAAVLRLPVLFFCQNNGYATSVPARLQMAAASVTAYAESQSIASATMDGNDVLEVYDASREAVARCRRGDGPVLLEAKTYRLLPHTSDDDDSRYRAPAEIAAWEQNDPIDRYRTYLERSGLLDDEAESELEAATGACIDDALQAARNSLQPDAATATRHVFRS